MADIEEGVQGLLGLAQLGLVVIGMDVSIAAFTGYSFLSATPGFFQDFTYAGGFVGALDNLYWLATDKLPDVFGM